MSVVDNNNYIVELKKGNNYKPAEIGNKAYNLSLLIENDFNVPSGFVITSKAFNYYYNQNNINNKFNTNNYVPQDLLNEIEVAFNILKNSYQSFAVRSSALVEDTKESSCAGLFNTELGVTTFVELKTAILKCWSIFLEILADNNYLKKNSIGHSNISLPLIVQPLINPISSGVLFSIHPINGDFTKQVLEASYGMCYGIVEGKIAVDRYILDKFNNNITKDIAKKNSAYYFDYHSNKLLKKKLAKNLVSSECITTLDISNLFHIADKVSNIMGYPQDIEWSIAEHKGSSLIYLLQTRPISTISTVNQSNIIGRISSLFTNLI